MKASDTVDPGAWVLDLSRRALGAAALGLLAQFAIAQSPPPTALPSWNDGAARSRIVDFVKAVTAPGGKDFVPPAERIAVFDNDGTLRPASL